MDNDDRQVGRILSRRELLALLGAAGSVLLAGCAPSGSGDAQPTAAASTAAGGAPAAAAPTAATAGGVARATQAPATAAATPAPATAATPAPTAAAVAQLPSCVVRPEQTEGPYFVDEKLNRSDIRSDPSDGSVKDGVPLQLTFRVSQVGSGGCVPLAGATVDVWHCDALGVYSDVNDPGFSTAGKKFLRGYQVTDANGLAQFTTIYPGWYRGRAVHIHFKIRMDTAAGQTHEFTSQLYFDEAVTDAVHAQAPYAGKGQRTLKNEGDGIFRNGGDQLLLTPSPAGQGYAATFDIGLQLT